MNEYEEQLISVFPSLRYPMQPRQPTPPIELKNEITKESHRAQASYRSIWPSAALTCFVNTNPSLSSCTVVGISDKVKWIAEEIQAKIR
ncbi:hypothetical protein HYQ46_006317 [Verticillium longisporum]|nr:hypothetical protein HYQ46_006317 [Verticillium longisporum]